MVIYQANTDSPFNLCRELGAIQWYKFKAFESLIMSRRILTANYASAWHGILPRFPESPFSNISQLIPWLL
jgi:hypothetical protein